MSTFRKVNLSRSICLLVAVCLCFLISAQVEICNNGIDDDDDLLIDLNDPDCECEVLEPISLIPNPSFEDMDCCPDNRSQLNCATDWIQASVPTTDYIHDCNWTGWANFPPPRPFPDGQGIMGFRDGRVINNFEQPNWKEYAGACLLTPLQANTTYRFQFDLGFVSSTDSPPIDITFFGSPDCQFLPFGVGNEDFGCPTNGPNWVKLGEVFVSGTTSSWVNTTIEVTPNIDIEAIAIGPPCEPTSSSRSTYYFFDNLLLADINSFALEISETNHPCSPEYSLSVPNNASLTYQWYKDGIALAGEFSSNIQDMYGEGIYQVVIDDGSSCRTSTLFNYTIPEFDEQLTVSICNDEDYLFGERIIDE